MISTSFYTRSSATVKGCLTRFRHMFENSKAEWVAGLYVEYTTVLEKEKNLKDEERKKLQQRFGVKGTQSRGGGHSMDRAARSGEGVWRLATS